MQWKLFSPPIFKSSIWIPILLEKTGLQKPLFWHWKCWAQIIGKLPTENPKQPLKPKLFYVFSGLDSTHSLAWVGPVAHFEGFVFGRRIDWGHKFRSENNSSGKTVQTSSSDAEKIGWVWKIVTFFWPT